MLFSTNERPFDRSWEEWTVKWWQWFLSLPKNSHPVYDLIGDKTISNQPDPNVWFLVGTTGGKAERIVSIPPGKAVLFPVINVTISYAEKPGLKTENDLTTFVRSHMNDIVKKSASLDGEDLTITENVRVESPPFIFSFPVDNIYGVPAGPTLGVGDGYWLFFKPLEVGKHTLKSFGSCLSGRVQIETNIQLIVEDSIMH